MLLSLKQPSLCNWVHYVIPASVCLCLMFLTLQRTSTPGLAACCVPAPVVRRWRKQGWNCRGHALVWILKRSVFVYPSIHAFSSGRGSVPCRMTALVLCSAMCASAKRVHALYPQLRCSNSYVSWAVPVWCQMWMLSCACICHSYCIRSSEQLQCAYVFMYMRIDCEQIHGRINQQLIAGRFFVAETSCN